MERAQQEDWDEPLRKARANKEPRPFYVRSNGLTPDIRNELLAALNSELLEVLSHVIEVNPVVDLTEFGTVYRRETKRITMVHDPSYPFTSLAPRARSRDLARRERECSSEQAASSSQEEPQPVPEFTGFTGRVVRPRHISDSYAALASLYGVGVTASNDEILTALLDQSLDVFEEIEEPEDQTFTYINVKDVIKTKGNAINGPKREDIGVYNRKLYESHTKQINRLSQDQLMVNLKFYPQYAAFVGTDTVSAADFVNVYKFNESYTQRHEHCMFLVHQKETKKRFTIIYEEKFLIRKMHRGKYECAMGQCKKKVTILHLEAFELYSIEFVSESAASNAYTLLGGIPRPERTF